MMILQAVKILTPTWDRWWPRTWWGRRGGWGRRRSATWCPGRWSRCRPGPRCRCRRSWWSLPPGDGWLALRCTVPPFRLIPWHFISCPDCVWDSSIPTLSDYKHLLPGFLWVWMSLLRPFWDVTLTKFATEVAPPVVKFIQVRSEQVRKSIHENHWYDN